MNVLGIVANLNIQSTRYYGTVSVVLTVTNSSRAQILQKTPVLTTYFAIVVILLSVLKKMRIDAM